MKKIYLLIMTLLIAQSAKSDIHLSRLVQTALNAGAKNFELHPFANTMIYMLGVYSSYYFLSNVDEKYALSKDESYTPLKYEMQAQPSSSGSETVMELRKVVDTDRLYKLKKSWSSFIKAHTILDNYFRLPMLGIGLLLLNNRFEFIK